MSETGKQPAPPLAAGDLVADKYRIRGVIAIGGMGAIMEAEHEELGQTVAVKLLHTKMLDNEEVVARFLREARVSARIKSEHVVRVFDVGRDDKAGPFMVMERLEGQDLDRLMQTTGAVEVTDAVNYMLQALSALIQAHKAGVVHRDIKPANLFLAQQAGGAPKIKVLDFGISKAPPGGGINPSLTTTRSMLGSPGYMSPEQIISTRDVDERSDLWSLGVILYENHSLAKRTKPPSWPSQRWPPLNGSQPMEPVRGP